MRTAKEVIERLHNEIGDEAFAELIPIINNGGIDIERLRRYFLKCDYWQTLKSNEGRVTATIERVSIDYDVCIRTVRNIVYK